MGHFRRFGDVGDELYVLPRREARDQVVELKHEAHVLAAEHGERIGACRHCRFGVSFDLYARGPGNLRCPVRSHPWYLCG